MFPGTILSYRIIEGKDFILDLNKILVYNSRFAVSIGLLRLCYYSE